MLKQALSFAAIVGLAISLMGCSPSVRSMGATVMQSPIQHKATKADSSNLFIAASGMWGHTDNRYNVKNLDAFGGNVDITYRVGRSPFFVSGAFGGFSGSLNFGCDEEFECDEDRYARNYRDWLKSSDGQRDYSFWNTQERVLAGLDFNPGLIILGFAGGLQMFQESGDYYNMRKILDYQLVVENKDGNSGMGILMAYWLGFCLGPNGGNWGNLVMEFDIFHKGVIADWTSSLKFTYAHPIGFFAGMGSNDLMDWTIYAGKQFEF